MTPKEKARELFTKFSSNTVHYDAAKQCAIIAVDEIIKTDMLIDEDTFVETPSYLQYWKEVKQELEKLKNK
jgi:hypothetical protein